MNTLTAILLINFGCVIGGVGAIFLKKASGEISLDIMKVIKNYHLMLGMIMYALASIIFIPTLKYVDLSIAYPFVATTHIWVCVFSKFFLKEEVQLQKWIGVVAIIIGVSLIGIGAMP